MGAPASVPAAVPAQHGANQDATPVSDSVPPEQRRARLLAALREVGWDIGTGFKSEEYRALETAEERRIYSVRCNLYEALEQGIIKPSDFSSSAGDSCSGRAR